MSDGCAGSERLRDSRLAELEGEASCFDEQFWFPPDESAEQSWYNCPPFEELFPEASEGDEIQPGVVEEKPTAPAAETQNTNFVSAGSWGEAVESNAFGAAFQSSQPTGMKHVWEQGIWADIFSERDPMEGWFGYNLKRPAEPVPCLGSVAAGSSSSESKQRKQGPVDGASKFAVAVSAKPEKSWQEDRDAQLDEALKGWVNVIGLFDSTVSLSQQFGEMTTNAEKYMMVKVNDMLGMKAPSTLMKRLRSVVRFVDWLRDRGMSFPADESVCYRYLLQQRESGMSARARKSFVEALTFCRHVLGVKELDPFIGSKRCFGNALVSAPKEKRRAAPLLVEELTKLQRILEGQLDDSHDDWDRLFCGTVFMAVYSRSRWADLMHSENIFYDRDKEGHIVFVECAVGVHKTMRSQQMKHNLLPVVAPPIAVCSGNWAKAWESVKGPSVPSPRQGWESHYEASGFCRVW